MPRLEPPGTPHISTSGRHFTLSLALYGSRHPTYRLVVWLYVIGGLAHLWLADAWDPAWLPANLFFLTGLALLARWGAGAGWLLCAVGKALPLLFHRDHLTQSAVLLTMALAGFAFMLHDGLRHARRGRLERTPSPAGPLTPGERAFFDAMRGITVLVYALAALHKLNTDFLHPERSCAVYGLHKLAAYYDLAHAALSPALLSPTLRSAAPYLVLAAEFGLVALYLLGRRRAAWVLATAFHIPLTLTMAPAYVFVMFAGHAAFVRPRDLHALRAILHRHGPLILTAASIATTTSLYLHRRLPEPTMIPREWLLWALLATLTLLLFTPDDTASPTPSPRAPFTGPRLLATLIVAGFGVHGLFPYLGLRYHQTGAMVSNLRIDQGCWNSLVFPESVRLRDDYVRVDTVHFREPGFLTEYEDIVLDQLWSPPQIRQMRRNWCRPVLRPIHLAGTFRDRRFVIDDLCDGGPLPFADDGVFGVELFPESLRFQKNLRRECPDTCIH